MNKQTYLNKINRRFSNLDQKVFARRWLAYRLEGGNQPIPSRWVTSGEVAAVKRIVDEIVKEAANA